MKKIIGLLTAIALLAATGAQAQVHGKIDLGPKGPKGPKPSTEKQLLKAIITSLAAPNMYGRGYISDGRGIASKYIQRKFKDIKLLPVPKPGAKDGAGTYVQGYLFPVNTFPGKMQLELNKTKLAPGEDFIIDAGSTGLTADKLKLQELDLKNVNDSAAWQEAMAGLNTDKNAYYLTHTDSACKALHLSKSRLAYALPKGCYIVPMKKLTWTVERDTAQSTVFYVKESAMPKNIKTVSVDVENLFIPKARSENVIGMLPGEVKDSFIVFSAHYDHLGMMGTNALFPGASDNASGTAMMLYLAAYFALPKNRPHYSMLFMAFSGEEAGLLGSEFYTAMPTVPLGSIKFLVNIDIMGDATSGITVVNAPAYPEQFGLMQQINEREGYHLPLMTRENTQNSDHYHFSKKGVPAFFIYSNGGKGYYHDIYDTADEVLLNRVDDVAKLLTFFGKEIN